MPRGHSGHLKEKYEHIKTGLEHLKYEEHKWIICVYLKIVKEGKQSFHVFSVSGTEEPKIDIKFRRNYQSRRPKC